MFQNRNVYPYNWQKLCVKMDPRNVEEDNKIKHWMLLGGEWGCVACPDKSSIKSVLGWPSTPGSAYHPV